VDDFCETFAQSYLRQTSQEAGAAAIIREKEKIRKYENLQTQYHFAPVGLESLGSWGPKAKDLIKDIRRRIRGIAEEPRSTAFLTQRISIELQRGNAACVLQTLPLSGDNLDEIFFVI